MFGGIVIQGDGIGKGLGYPTANLSIPPKDTKLKDGVFAAKAFLRKKEYNAALVIDAERKKVEVYLFEYIGKDFYGMHMEVEPVQKVSEIELYESEEKLKQKIERDIEQIKQVLFREK